MRKPIEELTMILTLHDLKARGHAFNLWKARYLHKIAMAVQITDKALELAVDKDALIKAETTKAAANVGEEIAKIFGWDTYRDEEERVTYYELPVYMIAVK